MTYFIIRNTLIMIYLFYNLHKKFEYDERSNKMSESQNVSYFKTEGVCIYVGCASYILSLESFLKHVYTFD